jgi:hypothetical protein
MPEAIMIIKSDNTKFEHTLVQTPYEAAVLFGSSKCEISHNTITGQLAPGYCAMSVTDGASWGWNGPATDNLVAFNEFENFNEINNVAGGGIQLNASYGYPITGNIIRNNKINNPVGRGIILSGRTIYLSNLAHNLITFNDFRGCYDEIWLQDQSLLSSNDFIRNLGNQSPDEPNRGQPPK